MSTAAGQATDKFPRENTGVGSARDLAANICMPAGCVTLLFPALKERHPASYKGRGGENGFIPVPSSTKAEHPAS